MMHRGISIHIGVNNPLVNPGRPLLESEANALRMAELASQAGYREIHVLRGPEATREAVGTLLAETTRALQPGHTLFVTFSGHGSRVLDLNDDEWDGWDETWCLHDKDLIDDDLAGYWRQLPDGGRAVVVSDSCFAGGTGKPAPPRMNPDDPFDLAPRWRPRGTGPGRARGVKQSADSSATSVVRTPSHTDGIRASVLWLAAASEDRHGQEGVYMPRLLEVWNGGGFRGSYSDLHLAVSARVNRKVQDLPQEPQLFMLGVPDPAFPLEVAFHLNPPASRGQGGPT